MEKVDYWLIERVFKPLLKALHERYRFKTLALSKWFAELSIGALFLLALWPLLGSRPDDALFSVLGAFLLLLALRWHFLIGGLERKDSGAREKVSTEQPEFPLRRKRLLRLSLMALFLLCYASLVSIASDASTGLEGYQRYFALLFLSDCGFYSVFVLLELAFHEA